MIFNVPKELKHVIVNSYIDLDTQIVYKVI